VTEDSQSRGIGADSFSHFAEPERLLSLDELGQLPVEEREAYWFKHYYQGDQVPQLTLRAVVIGALLGGLMSLSNLYIGLKTGWALGVAITACVMSYGISKAFRLHLSILENNCMQSTASSAGYSTGGTMVSAVAAYLMLTGHHMTWPVLATWTFFLAMLGVFIAIPMKRQMIDVDQLRFPSGIAAAETLRSLHSEGPEARAKANTLAGAGALSALWKMLLDFAEKKGMHTTLAPGFNFAGHPFAKWTIGLDLSLVLVAAGAIVGWKMCWSMMAGSILNYMVLAPQMVGLGAISAEKLGFREIVSWSTWTGAAMMVTSSLFAFALQWRTVARALSGLGNVMGGAARKASASVEDIQVPNSWFVVGTAIAGFGCVMVLHKVFDTAIWAAVVAVALSFVLSLVACRATGESDITPMGAMGKVSQLTFGVLVPSNMITNLMTASVTAGAASASADLLTDLKSGYILGANPKRQFIAQFLGVFTGTLVVVPAFYLLVPTAEALGGDQWPAPAATVWKKVAELLSSGVDALHPTARLGLLCGAVGGVLLPVIEMFLPAAMRRFIPSATGLGLAFVIPFSNALSFFIGAVLASLWQRSSKEKCEQFMVPLCSGVIAGESLTGVGIALKDAIPGLLLATRKG
jgi:putative OPT family oligopeptide transporter